jgi:hypothetical protein
MAATGGLLYASAIFSAPSTPSTSPSQYNMIRRDQIKQVPVKKEVNESELLSRLDKEGRGLYFSLDDESKKLARQLAADSGSIGVLGSGNTYRDAVEAAALYMAEQNMKIQERRLHNGMDRLPGKKKEL